MWWKICVLTVFNCFIRTHFFFEFHININEWLKLLQKCLRFFDFVIFKRIGPLVSDGARRLYFKINQCKWKFNVWSDIYVVRVWCWRITGFELWNTEKLYFKSTKCNRFKSKKMKIATETCFAFSCFCKKLEWTLKMNINAEMLVFQTFTVFTRV